MSTTSKVASVRPASSAATHAATESLTRPGLVLPVMMAILGRPATASAGAGAAGAVAAAALAVACSGDSAAAGAGLAADRRALDLLKRFLNQDMAAFARLLDVSTILAPQRMTCQQSMILGPSRGERTARRADIFEDDGGIGAGNLRAEAEVVRHQIA